MSTQPTRRAFLKAAAWTVPAVTLAATAPAYATSNLPPTQPDRGRGPGCHPKGNRSRRVNAKGRSKAWDYHLDPRCTHTDVIAVWVGGRLAGFARQGRRWTVANVPANWGRTQPVHIVLANGETWSGAVKFS